MNFGARVCPEMFLVGGWVLPELQQICGVQFGFGTNPGGHVTVSFGATVIFCVDGPSAGRYTGSYRIPVFIFLTI